LQITQVKPLAAANDRATTDVEIRWTAQVPRLTTIEGFDLFLEALYSDGSKRIARSEQLKASTRSAILQLATHPRQSSGAILKDFKVTMKARFRITSSFTVAQEVTTAQGGSARGSAGSSSASQPEVFITAAKLSTQGCSSGQQCVDVKWTATAPRNITINEFTVSVDALHKNGMRGNDSKVAGGADRQARLSAGPAGSEIKSIKVSLLTSFYSLGFKTVVKEGTLTQALFKTAPSSFRRRVKALSFIFERPGSTTAHSVIEMNGKTIFIGCNPEADQRVTTDTASKKWLSEIEISEPSETYNQGE
jgi:hypothetical protein